MMNLKFYAATKNGSHKIFNVGDVVLVPKPDIDTSRLDAKNLAMIIVEINQKKEVNYYRLATEKGVFESLMTSDNFTQMKGGCPPKKLTDTVHQWQTLKHLSMRQLCNEHSLSGGQGIIIQCKCRGKCDNRCKCFAHGFACSTHCHPSNTTCCTNKVDRLPSK
jgi:hypothetical protein